MTEHREYHDPQFARDEAGNQVVTRYPHAGEYPVTDRTGPLEQAIAEKAGLRLVHLNADGRVVEPLKDYLDGDTAIIDPSWRTTAATIRNEFHRPSATPSIPPSAPPAVTPSIPSSIPSEPAAWGVVRYEAGFYQTSGESMDDGMSKSA